MSVTATQTLTQQTVTVTGTPVENNVVVTVSNARGVAGTGGGGSTVTVSDTAPTAPSDGDQWLDSTTGTTWTWYVDDDGGQWINEGVAITQGAMEAAIGDTAAFRTAIEIPEAIQPARPDFYDDFERANTANGAVSDPPVGSAYEIRNGAGTGAGVTNIRIEDGFLRSDASATAWYVLQTLEASCYNIGARVYFAPQTSSISSFCQVVFLIKPTSAWLENFLHIIVTRVGYTLQVSESGGAGGLVTIQSGNFPANLIGDVFHPHDIEVHLQGNRMILTVDGVIYGDITDARIGPQTGSFVAWEAVPQTQEVALVEAVWANDPRSKNARPGDGVQGHSPVLDSLANGYAPAPIVTRYNTAKGGSIDVRTGRTRLHIYDDTVIASNTSTTETTLSTINIAASQLLNTGDRLTFEYWGTFAANGNNKTVRFSHPGAANFSTGARTTNGGAWHFKISIWKSAANNYVCAGMFSDDGGNKSFYNAAAALSPDSVYACSLYGTSGTASADITKVAGFIDWDT